MAKHFVTTMNKRLFDDYGKDLLISYMNTSQKYPIYVYVEDDIQKYPIMKNVIYVPLFKEEPECEKFVKRNREKVVASFMFDAVRFCYKVYAYTNEIITSEDYDGLICIDADSVFYKMIDAEWIKKHIHSDGSLMSYLGRGDKQYSECGFLYFNMTL